MQSIFQSSFSVFLVCALCFGSFTMNAQATLPDEIIEVEKRFRATLPDLKKLNTSPTFPEVKEQSMSITYRIPTQLLAIDYEAPEIRPVAMRAEPMPDMFNFYAKAGIGWPLAPMLEAAYSSGRGQENFRYRAFLKHHSMNNSASVENQRIAESRLGGHGTWFANENLALDFGLEGFLDRIYYFGYDSTAMEVPAGEVRQDYKGMDVKVGIFNPSEKFNGLDYKADLNLYSFSDRFTANELAANFTGSVSKWFDEKHPLTLDIGFLNSVYNDFDEHRNTVAYAIPSFTFSGNMFRIKAGAYLGLSSPDSTSFFPGIASEATLLLADGKFNVFAGWNSFIEQQTFRSAVGVNPWLATDQMLTNNKVHDRFAGLSGKLRRVSYEARVGWKSVSALTMYMNDFEDFSQLNMFHDAGDIYYASLSGSFMPIEKFEISLRGGYNMYNLDSTDVAYHLPEWEGNLGLRYKSDKFNAGMEFFTAGGINYMDDSGVTSTLPILLDVSLNGGYQFTKNFGGFVQINNIFNNKWERWHRYPTVGFNVMGGITVRF